MSPWRPSATAFRASGVLAVGFIAFCGLLTQDADASGDEGTNAPSPWSYQLYVDAGYAASDNRPEIGLWRSKSTTFELDSLELFLAMGNVRKNPTPESRWGLELGLQTGVDSEGLVPVPPPAASEPFGSADTVRHLYRANFAYRFGTRRGLRLTAGLINSHIGYESFLAIDNPNYTRGYILDTVPYFLIGLEALWDVSDDIDLGFYLVTGYNYLANPNDVPSTGFQVAWRLSRRTTFKQNLYYGPDQADTRVEFWRFLSDTWVEWKTDRFLLAAAVDVGTEKLAELPDRPRYHWVSGALWARWQLGRRWSVAVRPEFFWDPDGLLSGAEQSIQAYTGTLRYLFSPRRHRLAGTLEVRYDRSTGEEGGFFEGPDNFLVPDQTLVLAGLHWSFDQ